MGLYWPNFSLVFLIHLFLYVGVYCILFNKEKGNVRNALNVAQSNVKVPYV